MIQIGRGEKSLKGGNQSKLITFVAANAIGITLSFIGIETTGELVRNLGRGDLLSLIRLVGLPAVVSLALGVVSWAIPRSWKEVMVFWRRGPYRLPSREAFTSIATSDARINVDALSRSLGELPIEPHKQNVMWYAIYRKHVKEPAVIDANGAYLLYREMTAITPLLLIAAPMVGLIVHASAEHIAYCCLAAAVEYLALMLAARHAGIRLVGNVLAIESSTPRVFPPDPAAARAPRKKADPGAAKPKKRAAGVAGDGD